MILHNSLTNDQKRSLIFGFIKEQNSNKTNFILINKWYWEGTSKLTSMMKEITELVSNISSSVEIKPCIYETELKREDVLKILENEGFTYDQMFERKINERQFLNQI